MVKCLPAMQEIQVRSLGREYPLEKEMATHYSTLAWKIPWMEKPGELQSLGLQRVRHDWVTSLSPFTFHLFGTLLFFRWSSGCWQFDLWFLYLFWNQLEHLEVHDSRLLAKEFLISLWERWVWSYTFNFLQRMYLKKRNYKGHTRF